MRMFPSVTGPETSALPNKDLELTLGDLLLLLLLLDRSLLAPLSLRLAGPLFTTDSLLLALHIQTWRHGGGGGRTL